MRKRLILSGVSICLIAGLSILAAINTYRTPKPILDDITNCHIALIRYNDAFGQGNYIETEITEFDEKAVLKCISEYNEQKTFTKYKVSSLNDDEIYISVFTENSIKIIHLGKEDFSEGGYNSIKSKIINSSELKKELKVLINK